ncbi:hypothetical protein ACGF12_28485 [Kitasatospora sp. NPDC048296]|uniref:hypothetical protein n=1 Tax=Kitasatospora sp. NPDC048296 TaxID=3364048 RepID=UPI0037170E82
MVRLPKFPAATGPSLPVGANLRAYPGENPSASQAPVAQVPHGSKVTVKWNRTAGVVRHLHYRDQDQGTPIDVDKDHLVCGPLYQDTTFTLQTVSQAGGQPITRYDSLTVTVDTPAHPKLTLPNGRLDSSAADGLHIATAAKANQTLTVQETADFHAAASAEGALTAPTIQVGDLQFTGTFTATGTFTTNNLTAPTIESTNGLSVTGKVQILKAGRTDLGRSGTHTAATDGFVVARASDQSGLTLKADIENLQYRATTYNNTGTIVVPMKAGQTMAYGVDGSGGTVEFRWFALGR